MSQEETQKIRDTRIIAMYNDHNYSCSSRSSVDEQNKDRNHNYHTTDVDEEVELG